MEAAAQPLIDCHVHLLHPSRFAYQWLPADSPLRQDMDLAGLRALMVAQEVRGGVMVEATNHPDEIPWLLEQAEQLPGQWGVIGGVPIEQAEAVGIVENALTNPRFCGIRINGFRPEAMPPNPVMTRLQERGRVVELLCQPEELDSLAQLVHAWPGLTFVLDHLGGATLEEARLPAWQQMLRPLASLPNIIMKLSGYGSRVQGGADSMMLTAYCVSALALFGADRLIFGSDTPMYQPRCTYSQVVDLFLAAIGYWDRDSQQAVSSGTAQRVYFARKDAV